MSIGKDRGLQERLKINFAANFDRLLKERNSATKELREATGAGFQTVRQWREGLSMPGVLALHKIAGFFGRTMDDLLADPGKPPSESGPNS